MTVVPEEEESAGPGFVSPQASRPPIHERSTASSRAAAVSAKRPRSESSAGPAHSARPVRGGGRALQPLGSAFQ